MKEISATLGMIVALSIPASAQPLTGLFCLYAISSGAHALANECVLGTADDVAKLGELVDQFREHVGTVDGWSDAQIAEFEAQQTGSITTADCQRDDLIAFSDSILADVDAIWEEAAPLLASTDESVWGVCL